MKVKKRDGRLEEVNLDKITKSIQHACEGLQGTEPYQIAIKTVGGLYDGVSTEQLDMLSIQTAVSFIATDPQYGRAASRLLIRVINKEIESQDIANFSQSIAAGHAQGLISDTVMEFVNENKRKLNNAIKEERNDLFDYNGTKTIYDRYLLKHPISRKVMETPQFFLMRVACGLSNDVTEAIEFYNLLSSLEYMTSTPTLFNSGTRHSQMSSCFIEGTQVYTFDGVKNIEDVKIGDSVITHNSRKQKITQIHKNSLNDRQLYNLKCVATPEITVTENHRFWAINKKDMENNKDAGWISVNDLNVGDWIALPKYIESDAPKVEIIDLANYIGLFTNNGDIEYDYEINDQTIEITSVWDRKNHLHPDKPDVKMFKKQNTINRFINCDKDFATFLGIWYGDGTITSRKNKCGKRNSGISIVAHENNKELIDFCFNFMTRRFGLPVCKLTKNNLVYISCESIILGNVFEHLFGKKFNGKRLYKNMFNWAYDIKMGLLSGLISSDGCVSKTGQISISMANRTFVKDLYMMLRSMGHPVGYRNVDSNICNYQPQASISIPAPVIENEKIFKYYNDNRLELIKNKHTYSTKLKFHNGLFFARIDAKEKSSLNPEYVYTLGVENDHSYSIEGLLCENCYLLDSPADNLQDIYKRYSDVALLSKWAGGIGLSASRIRSSGSLIKGTNGKSNGIVPWLHTLSSSVAAVNQCFTPDTLVSTAEGFKPIFQLKPGDVIINTNHEDEIDEVMESDYNGELVVIKVAGKEYKMTPEHPIYCISNGKDFTEEVLRFKLKNRHFKPEWKEAQNITNNDIILSIMEK